ncbi:MAG: DUF3800 domain-containing protein [Candidatus Poribacteria bacterium]|nr:DUF3800 domain-containing protein [Candidatus Poribacteria bacterium]
MSNIYCYVDESGQHTQGSFFGVAAVIVKTVEMRDSGENMLLEVERTTEKGSVKWTKTHYRKKDQYLRIIATLPELKGCLFYSIYTDTRDYVGATVDTIARMVQQQRADIETHGLIIVIDGLDKPEKQRIAKLLKQAGVVYKKVRGAKDEGSAWIRLADAIAGFSWDVNKDKPYTQNLHSDMQQRGFLIQL